MKLNYSLEQIANIVNAELLSMHKASLVQQVQIDTRLMVSGEATLFVCLDAKRRGVEFIQEAHNKGCCAFMIPKDYQPVLTNEKISYLRVENVLLALQVLAKYHRNRFDYPVVGITGSFGKTMVKEWLHHFLRKTNKVVRSPKSFNSQIGATLSVLQMTDDHNLAIFEAGISKPDEMHRLSTIIQPTIGVFTGIGTAHDNGFESRTQKLEEKAVLFHDSPVVISENQNFQNSRNSNWSDMQFRQMTYGTHIMVPDFGSFFAKFLQKHKIGNLCAVLQLLKELDYPTNLIQEGIDSLPEVAMRMELIDGKNGNLLINDAYVFDGFAEAVAYLNDAAQGKEKWIFVGLTAPLTLADEEKNIFKDFDSQARFVLVSNKGIVENTVSFEQAASMLHKIENSAILFKGNYGSGIAKLAVLLTKRTHPTVVEINRQALRNNITLFRKRLNPSTKLMVMVKASAYGVGAYDMARFLEREGIDCLGVAFPDEGVNLRSLGVKLPIMVMNTHESAFYDVIENNLEPAIFSVEQLDRFTAELVRLGINKYPVHIKLETGMNRLGFRPEDINALCDFLSSQPEIQVKSVYSHLAESGNANRGFTQQQLQLFNSGAAKLSKTLNYSFEKHICNTDGIINYPEAHYDLVRLGIGLLGYASLPGLEHAMEIKTKISKVNQIKIGESLGYDRSFVADQPKEIAVLPIGYADGFKRLFGNGKGQVFIQGKPCQVLGNICMDMCFVDVTGLQAKQGDLVELIGQNVTVYDWAAWALTMPYEVITSLSPRLNRLWVD